jgi:hypothetical protein
MLPLTPANNWTATVRFCGGADNDDWSRDWDITSFPASTSCAHIPPDKSKGYTKDDAMLEGQSMANLIALPDWRVLCVNGAQMGTAGYGNESWAIGMSYADNPVLTPAILRPRTARWRALEPHQTPGQHDPAHVPLVCEQRRRQRYRCHHALPRAMPQDSQCAARHRR